METYLHREFQFPEGCPIKTMVIRETHGIDEQQEVERAQGLEFILWRVKLIGHMLHIVLKTEIGTGVTIEV